MEQDRRPHFYETRYAAGLLHARARAIFLIRLSFSSSLRARGRPLARACAAFGFRQPPRSRGERKRARLRSSRIATKTSVNICFFFFSSPDVPSSRTRCRSIHALLPLSQPVPSLRARVHAPALFPRHPRPFARIGGYDKCARDTACRDATRRVTRRITDLRNRQDDPPISARGVALHTCSNRFAEAQRCRAETLTSRGSLRFYSRRDNRRTIGPDGRFPRLVDGRRRRRRRRR